MAIRKGKGTEAKRGGGRWLADARSAGAVDASQTGEPRALLSAAPAVAGEMEGPPSGDRVLREGIRILPLAFYVHSSDGKTIHYVSPGYDRLWGRPGEELSRRPAAWLDSVVPADRERVRTAFIRRPGSGGFAIEYRIRRPDGEVRWVESRSQLLPAADGEGPAVIGFTRDITAEKVAEARSARHLEKLQELTKISLELNAAGTCEEVVKILASRARAVFDVHEVVGCYCEPSGRRVRLVSRSAAYRKRVGAESDFCCDEARARLPEGVRVVRVGPAPVGGRPQSVERDGVHAAAPLGEGLLAALVGQDGRCTGILQLRDKVAGELDEIDEALCGHMAEQASVALEKVRLLEQVTSAHENLKRLSGRLLEVQEAERRHIARELHDEIGQLLTGLSFSLEAAARHPDDTPAALGAARSAARELIERVRDLSLDLRPAMLDHLGLVPTLTWLSERFGAQARVRISLKHRGVEERRFDPLVETAAYRIVQEGLTNVVRHSGASAATVRLWYERGLLTVQVEDRGKGFAVLPESDASFSGGLSGMRERASLVGGRFVLEANPGEGTRITAELPTGCAAPTGAAETLAPTAAGRAAVGSRRRPRR